MSDATVLKEFLMSLGFKVDQTGQKKFIDSVGTSTVKVVQLGLAVKAASATVVAGVALIASNLENLYFASRRTGAAVENIQAAGFAFSNMGASAEGAVTAIENIARLMRNSPNGEGLLKNIGVQTRDANGQLRDTGDLLQDLGKKFADMPYYQANAYAQALGIDEKSLMAMREGTGEFNAEYKSMLRSAGLDAQEAASGSHAFMVELRGLGAAFTVLSQKVASLMVGRLSEDIKTFKNLLVANFENIAKAVSIVLDLLFRITAAVSRLVVFGVSLIGRLVGWFDRLSGSGKLVVAALAAIVVGWRALSLVIMASPIGVILALGTAILAVWEDYNTWREGGKSFIDWKTWENEIQLVIDIINPLLSILRESISLMDKFFSGQSKIKSLQVSKKTDPNGKEITVADEIGEFSARIKALLGDEQSKKTIKQLDESRQVGVGSSPSTASYSSQPAPAGKTSSPAASKPSSGAADLLGGLEQRYGLPKGLLDSVWMAESGRGKNMTSPVGAQGHFQFMPGTAKQYGLKNPNDLGESADAAARMYRDLLKKYGGDLPKALAGYNWGSGNVDKKGMGNLPAETRGYIAKITRNMQNAPSTTPTDKYADFMKNYGGEPPKEMTTAKGNEAPTTYADKVAKNAAPGGGNPYAAEAPKTAAAGATGAGGDGKQVSINQTTNINVTGSGDGKQVANDVAKAQTGVNERIVRNMRGAVA